MVKTPKKKLNAKQQKRLKHIIEYSSSTKLLAKKNFAIKAGVGISSIQTAAYGNEVSDFIIDKIIKAL